MSQDTETPRGLLERLKAALLDPHRADAILASAVAAEGKPIPTIWLLGKAQAGKTSIISALTGHPRAEVGNGFAPCTRTAMAFRFPEDLPLVEFLDTRGLGEVDYDPGDDLNQCRDRAHLVLAVCKVADPSQQAVFETLQTVRAKDPDVGIVIAQTGLHDLYAPADEHLHPYAYAGPDWPAQTPALNRALQAQRDALPALKGEAPLWVPVDLTRDEDGYQPQHYGLGALWNAIETMLPLGIAAAIRQTDNRDQDYIDASRAQILFHAYSAAGCGALPVVDIPAVTAIQAKLLHVLARQAGLSLNTRLVGELLGLLGAGIAGGAAVGVLRRSLVKLIPGWGQAVGAAVGATQSGAMTYALGAVAARFFRSRKRGEALSPEAIRAQYQEELVAGRTILLERLGRD